MQKFKGGRAVVVLAIILAFAAGAAVRAATRGGRTLSHHPRQRASAKPASSESLGHAGGAARPTSTRPAKSPPVSVPSAQHPLTVLVIGDSLGEDLGFGLRDLLGRQSGIRLHLKAVGSMGLVNVAYYNWRAALGRELATYHPQLVVALFGGNDALSFDQSGRYVAFGSALWRQDYGGRVAAIMQESLQAGARVVWVGLPVMAPSSVLSNTSMQDLNSIYEAEVKSHPGVLYVSTWSLFTNSAGQYVSRLKDSAGVLETVRDPDGVHIAPSAGTDMIASLVVAKIDAGEGILLCPRAGGMWQALVPKGCPSSPVAAAK